MKLLSDMKKMCSDASRGVQSSPKSTHNISQPSVCRTFSILRQSLEMKLFFILSFFAILLVILQPIILILGIEYSAGTYPHEMDKPSFSCEISYRDDGVDSYSHGTKSRSERAAAPDRSPDRHLAPAISPRVGTIRVLVLLIDFPDLQATTSKSTIEQRMNGTNNSVRNYYLQNSYNNLTIVCTVMDWVRASQPYAYYGADNPPGSGNDVRPEVLVIEAVSLNNPYINYSNYDTDNNGVIDYLVVLHAGGDQA
ncbi:MAG: immune inhibitor A, partial [Thermoplasmata archaeon]